MTVPSTPGQFAPDLAPDGVEIKFVTFIANRPAMVPDALHFHTNGASGEGSVDSAWNWSHAKPNANTLPHYQLDRTHNGVTRCRKMLPTNLKGIGSVTVSRGSKSWPLLTAAEQADILAHPPNRATKTIVVETADTGTRDDPSISAFDDGQLELAATILAFESIVHDIPIVVQPEWWKPGVAGHTDPFGYPYTTLYPGKICPGWKKKQQVRGVIIPRARLIRAAWTATPEPEEDDVSRPYICRTSNVNEVRIGPGDGGAAVVLRSREKAAFNKDWVANTMPVGRKFYHPLTGLELKPTNGWDEIPVLTEEQADLYVGYPDYERTGRDEG